LIWPPENTVSRVSIKNINYFTGCTLICPNKHEAELITNIPFNGKENLIKTGKKLIDILDSDYILVTCGEHGMFSYDKHGQFDFVKMSYS